MNDTIISANDPYECKRVAVLDTEMAYVGCWDWRSYHLPAWKSHLIVSMAQCSSSPSKCPEISQA
jgi:hypothetical protein